MSSQSRRYPPPRKQVDESHVIWAYDNTLREFAAEGMPVEEMRRTLREEWYLHVGRDAILSVLATVWPRG